MSDSGIPPGFGGLTRGFLPFKPTTRTGGAPGHDRSPLGRARTGYGGRLPRRHPEEESQCLS
jgi:hypothetical protein